MNCIVCVTSVPDTASVIKIGPDGKNIDQTGIKWIVSPFDEYALEEALQLTEAKGGEVTVVTYGPARAEAALRDCLARGAHKAVHVIGGETTLGDSFTIAKVLAKALEGREFDLVLCGNMGVGTDCSQVGQMLAELLGIPHVANVTKLEVGDSSLTAGRDVEGGQEIVECSLPAPGDLPERAQRAALRRAQGHHGRQAQTRGQDRSREPGHRRGDRFDLHRPQPRAAASQVGRHHHPG